MPTRWQASWKNIVTGITKRRYGTGMPRPDDRGAVADLALYAGQGSMRFATFHWRVSSSRDCGWTLSPVCEPLSFLAIR